MGFAVVGVAGTVCVGGMGGVGYIVSIFVGNIGNVCVGFMVTCSSVTCGDVFFSVLWANYWVHT